jgi:UDP-N-acetylmuramoyl-L-alanyl-D-glutamate--2,6-diaminopimelate ligase
MNRMKIKDLLLALPTEERPLVTGPEGDRDVAALIADTRQVREGALFVAIRGSKYDAHQDLAAVAARNPAGLIVEDRANVPATYGGAVIEVANSRKALALLASRFHGDPSLHLFCFGVTGTNGKTSCTYIMEHILNRMNLPTGVIGTVEHRLGDKRWPTDATTPGPLELQARLAEMNAAGARALAMEVSSHALDQYRADGVHFNAVLFTNLTRDHLDYHPDFESYFAAKQRLFTDFLWQSKKSPLVAAINIDDEWGRRLHVALPAEVITYGEHPEADLRFEPVAIGFDSTKFKLHGPFGTINADIPLCGRHNIANVVGCVAAAMAVGVAPQVALRSLDSFAGVPGRLQAVGNNRGKHVFVDYAHTPDALENVLKTLVQVRTESKSEARLRVVFGCGGDRDRGKRPLMAKIAENYADEIIVTSDNPRTEDPAAILREIEEGLTGAKPARSMVDRREAIHTAIRESVAGDIVLIAGKGHEDYQILGTEKIHFSDVEVAREGLK